ncbi:MAG: transglutaminase-like domain-containing protein [Treponema sp.]|nr:transglutaminase-like domain-containing protein [Treponema sp.]MCL2272936.1 transglutaminase-like domain-containing protein [Treponema sp.]
MSSSRIILFNLRLILYFSIIFLIFIHPGITVSFDRIGIFQWFIIIPVMAVIAFLPEGKPFKGSIKPVYRNKFIFASFFLILISLRAGGFGLSMISPFLAGFISFSLTWFLFSQPRKPLYANLAKLSALEPFFLAWVCLRLLALSRSGEDIAGQSMALTQFILVWTAVVFLLHSVVVYFCIYPQSTKGALREGVVFSLAAAAVLILVIAVLPSDFINNRIINNLLSDRMPQKMGDDSEYGKPEGSDSRNEGRRSLPRSTGGRQPGLRGVSEYNWQNRTGRGRGAEGEADNRQYMVMVVASDREPVYMGDSFRGHLDPQAGFQISSDEPINRIVHQRFFVTWFNSENEFDAGRKRQEVFSLSTLQQKYLPWRPLSIDPTILSEDTGPLRYIHQVVSNTHAGDPLQLINTPSRSFNIFEENNMAPYLMFPLERNDIDIFNGWLNNALDNWKNNRGTIIRNDRYLWEVFSGGAENLEPVNEYLEIILAILTGFSEYQYNLSYSDDSSVAALKDFLLNSKEGDCVEFSNTLALLGRLAGIPSRVVTGYLAAEELQTNAHLRGLSALREKIPVLKQYPLSSLFMVTNLHSHSWTQFFIPDYGWLDFEATAFALPPLGMGDFNSWDVVIPIIEEERLFSRIRKFPWTAVLRSAGILAGFALVLAYSLRYGRELVLFLRARSGGRAGARSFYLLLLAKLAADGKPIKPASKTAHEYSQLFPMENSAANEENLHFKSFADIYSELRWREYSDSAEQETRFNQLKQEYENILASSRCRGLLHAIKRILSLRGLAYL